MTETNFIKQLKDLKKITPDQAWLKSNREILLTQIVNSGAKELSVWKRFIIDARSFTMTVSQPAMILGALFLFVAGASAFSYQAFNRTKPNESLYIARIISEKAKLSTVFDIEEKAKLEVQFAANHAEAITDVLANAPEGTHDDAKVAALNKDFDKEISTVRARISSIKSAPVAPAAETVEDVVITAGSEKDGQGIQLSINNGTAATATAASTTATTTEPVKIEKPEVKKAEDILDEAKSLFDNKEYDSAKEKLQEVRELIK